MTISSSGLIEWTPSKSSEITTHSNIKITITTASGYVLTQTYDLTVTGTCTSGNCTGQFGAGDQRTSTDSNEISRQTSVPILIMRPVAMSAAETMIRFAQLSTTMTLIALQTVIFGPTAVAGKGSVHLLSINTITYTYDNQYDNTTHLYFYLFLRMFEERWRYRKLE